MGITSLLVRAANMLLTIAIKSTIQIVQIKTRYPIFHIFTQCMPILYCGSCTSSQLPSTYSKSWSVTHADAYKV